MHIATQENIAQAERLVHELEQAHSLMEIGSPDWRGAVWSQASINGWLHVARSHGVTRYTLAETAKDATALLGSMTAKLSAS